MLQWVHAVLWTGISWLLAFISGENLGFTGELTHLCAAAWEDRVTQEDLWGAALSTVYKTGTSLQAARKLQLAPKFCPATERARNLASNTA